MNFQIHQLHKSQWDELYAKNAHECVFEEPHDPESSRADYALLVVRPDLDQPVIYVTIKELTSKTAAIEYGGSFPAHRGSPLTYRAYEAVIDFMKEKYQQVHMLIRNDNRPMLKFALKSGFMITGVSVGAGNALLTEHTLDFKKGE
jgi:hypothetical protein